MTVSNIITTAPSEYVLLVDLSRSIQAIRELSDLTCGDDPNSHLLALAAADLERSFSVLLKRFA